MIVDRMSYEKTLLGASVSITELSKAYELDSSRRLVVFDNLNIEIQPGTFAAILGPSGCGKSTLLRMIARLEAPTKGRIEIRGDGPQTPRVGMMLQGYPTLPWLTVSKNIELALRNVESEGTGHTKSALVNSYLSRVGLFGWQDAYPRELSGGMLQRVALARTLAMRPHLVLLDEPLGALDALTRIELQALLRELHRSEGTTFVMVTHDVEEALAVANRIIVLGPSGTGILYDSDSSAIRMTKDGLLKLLASTHVTFAAGTWSGYLPLAKTRASGSAYRFWMGQSDSERIAALKEGRAAGAFFTIQALAERRQEFADMDAVIVHAFSRPNLASICEHILLSPQISGKELAWAAMGGLETKIIARVDSMAAGQRIKKFPSRVECVQAVARRAADACIVDPQYARQLLGRNLSGCTMQPLPDNVWPDLWTVLVARRGTASFKDGSLRRGVKALGNEGNLLGKAASTEVHYFGADESEALLRNGRVDRLLERWDAEPLPIAI
jgi:ABC-type nitrate/sulfonate/bicarbonate transport system ATPase subunit